MNSQDSQPWLLDAILFVACWIGLLLGVIWFSQKYQEYFDAEAEKIHQQDRINACDPYIYEQYYKY